MKHPNIERLFEMSVRYWTFTLNNYTEEDEAKLLQLGNSEIVRYLVYGREVGDLSLIPHLQGFIAFKSTKRLLGVKKLIANPQVHLDPRYAGSTNEQAATYCKKDGDFVEFGQLSQQGRRTDLDEICEKLKDGSSIQSIAIDHSATFVRNYRGLSVFKSLLTDDFTPASTRGLWYWGEPGTGKSRKARQDNPDAYLKSQNKWWDGYSDQKVVIWDDLDRGAIGLGHHLKIWTDRYPCSGEIKGGTLKLQHETLIVTSNYNIDQLWGDDPEMCKAIKRRFLVTHFTEFPLNGIY